MKIKIVLCGFVWFCATAAAQTVPIACEQHFQALEACSQNEITALQKLGPDRIRSMTGHYDPNGISDLKTEIASIKTARATIHKVMVEEGEEAANNKFCANQFYIGRIHMRVYGVKSNLEFLGLLDANCSSKIQAISN